MEYVNNSSATPILGPQGARASFCWLLILLSLLLVVVVLPMTSTGIGMAIVSAWVVLIWVGISFIYGQFHYVVLMWVAVYPYCYYFLSYPKEQSIFTVDRALGGLLLIGMFLVSRKPSAPPLSRDVHLSAYFWSLYLVACALSLVGHPPSEALMSYRLLVDGMVMPMLFGLYAMRYFPLLANVSKAHTCVCILAMGLCITGVFELTTGIDLFPWAGANPQFTDTRVRRADGPFEQPGILSLVAILAFFLMTYLRRLMPVRVSSWRALLHKTGFFCSFIAALAPLNRGLVVVLVPVAVIDWFSPHRMISRKTWAAIFGSIVLVGAVASLLYPALYEDRTTKPDNLYQRFAQDRETIQVVREHPIFGVGFNLYYAAASQDPRYLAKWKGIISMNLPHNVIMTVLSEEGVIGLFFWVGAQVFLVRAMWKMRRAFPVGWLAFLYCFLVYSLIGLDDAIVYFADVNLIYMFALGLFLQVQARMQRAEETVTLESALTVI
jgi:O-antigen ligase